MIAEADHVACNLLLSDRFVRQLCCRDHAGCDFTGGHGPAPIADELAFVAEASLPITITFSAVPMASAPIATPLLFAAALLLIAISLLPLVLETPRVALALFGLALLPIAVAVGSPLSLAPPKVVVKVVPATASA